jgi:photosystem II stability/assembly factor-like uncharacterized protein
MDPTNPNHLFLGLGDGASAFADQPAADGIGLYTSQDGGNTWTLLGNWIQTGNNTTRILQILCLDANTLFVGGNDGLWKSSDAGSTWNRINVGTGSSSYVWSIAKLSATELVLGLTDKNDLNGAI